MKKSSLWAMIPVKDFVNAKQRLSGVLSPSERRALSQAMVEDMLECLGHVAGIDGVLLVSDDPGAELLAYRYGARVIKEKGHSRGLNAAVAQAASHLPSLGASHMLVLHGDLPCIDPAQVSTLISDLPAGPGSLVRLVPDGRRQGSNGLLCSLPTALKFCYGENSFALHVAACAERGIDCQVIDLPSLQLDIDTPGDLQQLLLPCDRNTAAKGKTAAVLAEYGVASRLRQMCLSDQKQSADGQASSKSGVDHAS
jgi:2-phospho-L-lactate guanylyltransferase